MNEVNELKAKVKSLEKAIRKFKIRKRDLFKAILISTVAIMAGGTLLGYILGKMLKILIIAFDVSVLAAITPAMRISKINRNIYDASSQIEVYEEEIEKLEDGILDESIKQIKKNIDNNKAKQKTYEYKPSENKSEATKNFEDTLKRLNEEHFFDFRDNDEHKTR